MRPRLCNRIIRNGHVTEQLVKLIITAVLDDNESVL